MQMIKCFLVVTVLLFIAWVPARQTGSFFKKDVYISQGDTLPYRLAYPQNYKRGKKYPLVLFLHGAGARGKDNELQLTGVPAVLTSDTGRSAYPCFILAPQCPKRDVWVKFPHFPESIRTTELPTVSAALTFKLLDSLLKNCPVDRSRVYITGYSMGGEGTFDFLTRRPELFAAAVPVCSVADTSRAASIHNIPLWAFHGDKDDVNDVKYTRMEIAALKNRGGKPRYTEYPGVKHNSWVSAYRESELFPWLFAQRLKRQY